MINVNLDYYTNLCYDKFDMKNKLYKLLTVWDKIEKQKEIVFNMYNDNVNLETISKYTELSVLKIEKIISEDRD